MLEADHFDFSEIQRYFLARFNLHTLLLYFNNIEEIEMKNLGVIWVVTRNEIESGNEDKYEWK